MKTDTLSGYNPLRGLDLPGLINMIERGEEGYYRNLMWLYRLILQRNGTARAVRRKLTGAIGRLDWNIKIPTDLQGDRKALAERQQEGLRAVFDNIDNLRQAAIHLAMADLFGFAHVEKIYARDADDPWAVRELRIVPQWHLRRRGLFAPWAYDADARDNNIGTPIPAEHWIWRDVEDPACQIFAIAHLKMSTTDADWDQFCDTYAVPPIFVEQPPNVPRGREDEYQATAEAIVSDGRGSLPHGAKVHTVTPGTSGESVFTERLRYYREEIVLAGTGGILTTLDGNTGIGKGPSESHDDTWLDIAADICGQVSDAFYRGLCQPWLDRNFPGQERLAYFEYEKPQRERDPSTVLLDAKTAKESGLQIDPEDIAEKSGYKIELAPVPSSEPAPAPAATSPATATDATPAANAIAPELPRAVAQDLGIEEQWLAPAAPILAEIEQLLADPSTPLETIQAKLQEAIDRIPELLGQLNIDALANLLERDATQGALAGLSESLRLKRKS
jgi:hypothetical protein